MLYLAFLLFIAGSLLAFKNKTAGYMLAATGSIVSLITGILSRFFNYHPHLTVILTNHIHMEILLTKTGGLFVAIASISWLAVSVFSIDLKHYRRRMAIFLNLSLFGMLMILSANDAVAFLAGWEIMSIFSMLMITESRNAYKEAFLFFAFSELSTVALIVAFVILYTSTGTFSFNRLSNVNRAFIWFSSLAFIAKMGIVPFHIWLKEAHAKAPSNASALLSAPVTLMGFYGLIRTVTALNHLHLWGIIAIILGSISAFFGAIAAASAKGLKTLPAHSTVENNGMMLAAIGLSVVAGSAAPHSTLSQFAYLTAIMLAVVHTVAKSLLFLSIGEAKEKLHAESIDEVRGIHKSVGIVPAAGIVFAGLSFSAFPLLLGYVAEWMLLESIFQSYQFNSIIDRIVSSAGGVLLSLAMGFAAFSMVKLIGYSALGYTHEKHGEKLPSHFMKTSQLFLISLLIVLSFFATFIFKALGYSQFITHALVVPKGFLIASAKPVFGVISPAFLLITTACIFVAPFLVYLHARRNTRKVVSWNGGLELKEDEYFTAGAFTFIIEYILRFVYATKEVITRSTAYVTVTDLIESAYHKCTGWTQRVAYRISIVIMNGKTYLYVFYILVVFILMFIIFG